MEYVTLVFLAGFFLGVAVDHFFVGGLAEELQEKLTALELELIGYKDAAQVNFATATADIAAVYNDIKTDATKLEAEVDREAVTLVTEIKKEV